MFSMSGFKLIKDCTHPGDSRVGADVGFVKPGGGTGVFGTTVTLTVTTAKDGI